MKINAKNERGVKVKKQNYFIRLFRDIREKPTLYLMIVPVLAYFIIFHYVPMYGALIAFQDYVPIKGMLGSKFVGFKHFESFLTDVYFFRLLRNTLRISILDVVVNFFLPIIFALLLNEVTAKKFRKTVQTVSYVPHFISTVVVCGMIKQFTADTGFITNILAMFGFDKVSMLAYPQYYVPIHIISNTWQKLGWSSIIYMAAISGINQELYEAAEIDGAGRFKQALHVTIPGIMGTIVILLVLKIGTLLTVGYEKIILLYNPSTYETADVISSYVYRKGLLESSWSYSTAVGLFNSIVNVILLVSANVLSKKMGQSGLF